MSNTIDEDSLKKIVAVNLQHQMDINSKSRQDVAKGSGISYTAICSWLSGARVPKAEYLDKLCSYFNCKRSDLLIEKENNREVLEISEIDALLAQVSAKADDLDTRFFREYVELNKSQKALLLDVMRQFKKD